MELHHCDFSGILLNVLFLAQLNIKELCDPHQNYPLLRMGQSRTRYRNGRMVDEFASSNSSPVMGANMVELMHGFVNSLFHQIDLFFLRSSTLLLSLDGTV